MNKLTTLARSFSILHTLCRHVFNRVCLPASMKKLRRLSYLNPYSYCHKQSRGISLRRCLEKLGPIYIKLGQLLSLRDELFDQDIIVELVKLQNNVVGFPGEQAIELLETAYQQPLTAIFSQFDVQALACASIAQVHSAVLHNGDKVVVKIVRPGIKKTIRDDIQLLYAISGFLQRQLSDGKRLRLKDIVAEFEYTIIGELDMNREAANASVLAHNFKDSTMMSVPKVYWPYTRHNVLVMERVVATPISELETLRSKKVNFKQLAEYGVEIFFTQVLRDSFFHADMHPGNLFIDTSNPEQPKYIGVDFGIMGSLNDSDKRYLAENLLAFFNRDYRRVAQLHIESGWVAANTRVEQFETAIRSIAEPVFQKPLQDISFADSLLRLLQVARDFSMPMQPQLLLLQKTLVSIEALGRKLYPELDLWQSAKPLIEKWLKQQSNPKALLKKITTDLGPNVDALLAMPKNIAQLAERINPHQPHQPPATKKRQWLAPIGIALVAIGCLELWIPSATLAPYEITAGMTAGLIALL